MVLLRGIRTRTLLSRTVGGELWSSLYMKSALPIHHVPREAQWTHCSLRRWDPEAQIWGSPVSQESQESHLGGLLGPTDEITV